MADLRARPLRRRDLRVDPLEQLRAWQEEAARVGVDLPERMALATASQGGAPSVRMVLLKGIDSGGLVFFTGYSSRKAVELEANPRAALLLYWHDLGRQARVEGAVSRTSVEESEAYFRTRPPGARLAAAATQQGTVVGSREEIEARVAELERAHPDGDVPLPEHWGGYRLTPHAYEFWQHRESRLHDRFRYRRDGDAWVIDRLAP